MSNLLILGAGQYGSVTRDIAKSTGLFDKIDFLDDNNIAAIGKISDYTKFSGEYSHAVVAMGNPELRLRFLENLKNADFNISPLISPLAFVSGSAEIGDGTIIEPMAVVNANAVVETGCIISAGAVVNHNAVVEKGCHIDCNATVCARAVVKEETKIPYGKISE